MRRICPHRILWNICAAAGKRPPPLVRLYSSPNSKDFQFPDFGGLKNITPADEEPEQGPKFNELFIKEPRKLSTQIRLERITGRIEDEPRIDRDIADRLATRKPRKNDMSTEQDWPSVWPAAASFRSSVVPLPVRMGYRKNPKLKPPVKQEGNLELLKIPNFLHLTPPHIKRHCEAIKKFCTPFPKQLSGRMGPNLIAKYLPVKLAYSDYVHQGTNLRDARARVVTMTLRLAALDLDTHAHNKMRQLVGDRYDEETDTLTLVADRCPTRRQNMDYVNYLLTALYHESKKVEPWEENLTEQIVENFSPSLK